MSNGRVHRCIFCHGSIPANEGVEHFPVGRRVAFERLGAPDAVTRELSTTGLPLDALLGKDRRAQALALEIALNEENERRLLAMELTELEARWRQQEEIAAIADGLLTPRRSEVDVRGVP
ncbi:MAG: hypothetical protein R3314_03010 [Longimicrobiales bacterium]|nr:hypothetical protein [Longimicrobiales bacterium]